jgi:hypothetical protein
MPVSVSDPAVFAPLAALSGLRLRAWLWLLATKANDLSRRLRSKVALPRRGRHHDDRATGEQCDQPREVCGAWHQKMSPTQFGNRCAGHPLKPENAIISLFWKSLQRDQNEPSGMSMFVPRTLRGPPFHKFQEFCT